MLTGMDDADDVDDAITLEAISGLSRVLEKVTEGHVRAILINIALRIRPSFAKVRHANNYRLLSTCAMMESLSICIVVEDNFHETKYLCQCIFCFRYDSRCGFSRGKGGGKGGR